MGTEGRTSRDRSPVRERRSGYPRRRTPRRGRLRPVGASICTIALIARSGVRCPVDGTEFVLGDAAWHRLPKDSSATCPICGWQTTVAAWHDSFRKQDLNGMAPFIEVYVASWPTARSYRDRMLLVDRLLHEVHATGGNLARTLIEGGKRNSPHAFLTASHTAQRVPSTTRRARSSPRHLSTGAVIPAKSKSEADQEVMSSPHAMFGCDPNCPS